MGPGQGTRVDQHAGGTHRRDPRGRRHRLDHARGAAADVCRRRPPPRKRVRHRSGWREVDDGSTVLSITARRRGRRITATARPSRSAGKACAGSTPNSRNLCLALRFIPSASGGLPCRNPANAAAHAVRRRAKTRRAKPGARGQGGFFHIQVRPRTEFVFFRNQDVGRRGGIERVAGRRANGSWDTQKWLIGKIGGAPRGQEARAGHARPRAKCSSSSARCRAISAATASSPSRAAISRQAKSRRRPCAAPNSPTSRRRRPRCASGGGNAHDPQAATSGKYRLYSRKKNPRTGKRRNLGTFSSRKAAEQHERAVQYFKRH